MNVFKLTGNPNKSNRGSAIGPPTQRMICKSTSFSKTIGFDGLFLFIGSSTSTLTTS